MSKWLDRLFCTNLIFYINSLWPGLQSHHKKPVIVGHLSTVTQLMNLSERDYSLTVSVIHWKDELKSSDKHEKVLRALKNGLEFLISKFQVLSMSSSSIFNRNHMSSEMCLIDELFIIVEFFNIKRTFILMRLNQLIKAEIIDTVDSLKLRQNSPI